MSSPALVTETINIETKTLTPLQAVRKYCLWCCCDQASEVSLCFATECLLWDWRHGKKPGPGLSTLKVIRARHLGFTSRNA